MKDQWVMTRLKKATHAKLCALKVQIESQESKPKGIGTSQHDRFGITLDDLVSWLIKQETDKRDRSNRKSKTSGDA